MAGLAFGCLLAQISANISKTPLWDNIGTDTEMSCCALALGAEAGDARVSRPVLPRGYKRSRVCWLLFNW